MTHTLSTTLERCRTLVEQSLPLAPGADGHWPSAVATTLWQLHVDAGRRRPGGGAYLAWTRPR